MCCHHSIPRKCHIEIGSQLNQTILLLSSNQTHTLLVFPLLIQEQEQWEIITDILMKNKQNKLLQDDTKIRFTEFGFRLHVVREGVRFSPVHSVTVRAGCNWKNSQAKSLLFPAHHLSANLRRTPSQHLRRFLQPLPFLSDRHFLFVLHMPCGSQYTAVLLAQM